MTRPAGSNGTVPQLGLNLSLTYRRRAEEFGLYFLVISSNYYGAILIHHNFQLSWPAVAHLLACAARSLPRGVCRPPDYRNWS